MRRRTAEGDVGQPLSRGRGANRHHPALLLERRPRLTAVCRSSAERRDERMLTDPSRPGTTMSNIRVTIATVQRAEIWMIGHAASGATSPMARGWLWRAVGRSLATEGVRSLESMIPWIAVAGVSAFARRAWQASVPTPGPAMAARTRPSCHRPGRRLRDRHTRPASDPRAVSGLVSTHQPGIRRCQRRPDFEVSSIMSTVYCRHAADRSWAH
jgi:hypothetical protein